MFRLSATTWSSRSGYDVRHGTQTLIAALEIATGKVVAHVRNRRTSLIFLRFMNDVARTFEVVGDHRGGTYRAVYTVRFEGVVYVLHASQKKSPSGIRTSTRDVELVGRRLKEAKIDFEVKYGKAER
jgi:hypothetical protein